MEKGSDTLSTAQTARLVGVTPSSIKRWADEGALPCSRTAGGHRRFIRGDVERFVEGLQDPSASPKSRAERWVDTLMSSDAYGVLGKLLMARSALGAWHRVADELGEALGLIGIRWRRGEMTVLQEHLASERLHRGLAQVAAGLAVPDRAPVCLLTSVPGDDHTLGLSLAELCLRDAGWSTLWAGRQTPEPDMLAQVASNQVMMVAVSASSASSDEPLTSFAKSLGAACAKKTIPFVMGGNGPWPTDLPGAVRVSSFVEFHGFLESLGEAS